MRPLVAVRRAAPFDPDFVARHPLLRPLAAAAARLDGGDFPDVTTLNRLFADDAPVRFVASAPRRRRGASLDPDTLYDARIAVHGEVPTRARCWHDLMNALVWATYPAAKATLHARQHRAIARRLELDPPRLPPTRSRELDALALLDEGGIVLLAGEGSRVTADVGASGRRAVERAIDSGAVVPLVFGHAVFESLVLGVTPAAVAAVLVARPDPDLLDDADRGLARAVGDADRGLARAVGDADRGLAQAVGDADRGLARAVGDADRGLARALGDEERFRSPRELFRVDLSRLRFEGATPRFAPGDAFRPQA